MEYFEKWKMKEKSTRHYGMILGAILLGPGVGLSGPDEVLPATHVL